MSDPHRSLWMEQVRGDHADRPPLTGAQRADIAIVGGGYVGLWTALMIKELEPTADVVVLEQDICGGGASGANGGMVLSWWAKLGTLTAILGEAEAHRLARASADAVDEIGAFCAQHGIDAEFRKGGWLWTATTRAQLGAWDATLELAGDVLRPADDVAARSGSGVHIAGVFEASAATVHPAKLVRGLRRVALQRGVRIHEHTRVRRLQRGAPPVLTTPNGRLVADRAIVATNAWAAGLRELHRRLAVVSSDVVATAPAPDRLAEIGWTGGEGISDSQLQVHYYRNTADGRVVFGKGGWGIAFGGRIGDSLRRHAGRAREVERSFRRIYPGLADVAIAHDWAGPIDRPSHGLPLIGRLGGRDHLLYGVGWSGNGVGPSRIGARMLAALATDRDDEWSRSPLIDRMPSSFPPEPIRYAGAHLVRAAVVAKERAEERDRRPGRPAIALAGLAPTGMTPTRRDRR